MCEWPYVALPLRDHERPSSKDCRHAELRRSLEDTLAAATATAAFVVAGIGSLRRARIRRAGVAEPDALEGSLEILTLCGTISRDGAHLHISVADGAGPVTGGHVAYGCEVRTTAEVSLLLLPEWSFTRELDTDTGYSELVVRASKRDSGTPSACAVGQGTPSARLMGI